MKPDYQNAVMKKNGFMDWDSVLAAIGHGALKEGQIANRMQELYEKDHPKVISNEEVLAAIAENSAKQTAQMKPRSKNGIVVKGIHDVAVRFSKCCSPVPGDEIVGFVTRGRGISIHRTDCINVLNLPEIERARLIEAEWEQPDRARTAKNMWRRSIFLPITEAAFWRTSRKTLTERNIDIQMMHTRTNKQGIATLSTAFEISSREELNQIVAKLRNIESVIDIERTTG